MEEKEQILTSCDNGGPIWVHVKDGRIIRIRPIVYDDSFKTWSIQVGNQSFSPLKKATVAPFTLAGRQRAESPDRVQFPMKRIDFDPGKNRSPETRGRSGYERISWDQALDLVAGEIKRAQGTYGKEAILGLTSSHQMWGISQYRFSTFERFFGFLGGTRQLHNPDSWEGFLWGLPHVWGFYWRLGMAEQYDLLEDAMKHSEMIVYWSNDPDSTRGLYGGQESAIWRLWLRELGKTQVFIDPFCNYTASILADKWIAPRPGTDAALALAIAFVWFNEGTYDKAYVETHTVGFEHWQNYVMGKEDGIPKTPQWAGGITGVPARVIKSLARQWAAKTTMLATWWGGAARAAYAHEWTRMILLLQAMQGLGKPGVNIWAAAKGAPQDVSFKFPGYTAGGMNIVAKEAPQNPVQQSIYRLLIPEGILNPPIHWKSVGFCGQSVEQQFEDYVYPLPGHSEIHLLYRFGGSYIGTMTDTNRWVQAYRSPKIECVVSQTPWWEPETKLADIVLPVCTSLERTDLAEWASAQGYIPDSQIACNHRVFVYQKRCIEPRYESKSDYQIFAGLSGKLGFGERYTEGNSEEDWVRKLFEASPLRERISFEAFEKKGYYVMPLPEDYQPNPAMRWFYEKGEGLATPSKKIEFFASSLHKYTPEDKERPPVPHYIPSWEGPDSELAKKYPLQLITPHPRYDFHTHNDAHSSWLWEIPGHRIMKDGYSWWPIRIHPADAKARGVGDRDIVKVFNDRGAVLCIALVTERMRPGTVHAFESSGRYDPVGHGKPDSLDRGGCMNLLTPARMISKNAPGMAPNSCLVQIVKWEG